MHFFELILALKRKCLATEEQAREELGLSPAEFNALLCVDSEEKITGHCFSLRAGLSPSRASRVQWRLISRKLLRSSADRNDRRNKLISLTPEGVSMKKRIEERMLHCEKTVRSKLKRDDIACITKALIMLEKAL